MHRADVVHGDRPRLAGQRDRRGVVHVAVGRVHGAAEHAIRMVVVDRSAMAARHDHQRAVLHLHVVEHHADRGEVVIAVRIERPVLVPFDRRAEARAFQVQLGGVEPDVRTPQRLQHAQDGRVPRQRGIGGMVQMRGLDPAHPRRFRRVAVFQVVDVGVRREPPRPLDEAVGDGAQLLHLRRGQDIRHDDGADVVIFGDLGLGQHRFLPGCGAKPTRRFGSGRADREASRPAA